MTKEIRILLTGGGTGGHIYPLIAVAKRLANVHLRYFGDPGLYKNLLENSQIEINKIISSKFRRYFSLLNILDTFKFVIGFIQALWEIFWFMPDAAFSKGGPGALPILLVCRFYFIPIVIHESDAIPGLTNKITARYAKKVKLAFGAAQKYFNTKAEIEIVGQPVREEILKDELSGEVRREFGFNENKPIILFLGGSQGSTRINDFVLSNLELFLHKFQILHQVGEKNYQPYKNSYDFISKNWPADLKNNYFLTPYFEDNLASAFNVAEVVISRAGAGAIFEIAAKAKPSILIPFPEAANNHQQVNAYEYQKTGAAIIIEQANLLPNLIINVIENLLKDQNKLKQMSAAAKQFYKPKAAEQIAENIKSLLC